MRKVKEILTDCLLIVPYTVIWLIALLMAAVIVSLYWVVKKLGGERFGGV